jgi:outer membrane immunogenic protein
MKVRTALVASLATLGVACSTVAYAADLPARQTAPPPAPVITPWSWAGVYIGAYAGGAWGKAKTTDVTVPTTVIGSPSLDSVTVGGLVGYNVQYAAFVGGLEGEYGYDNRRGTSTYLSGTRSAKFDGSYIGRLRARAGYAFGNALLYVAGGFSFADGRLRNTNNVAGYSISVRKDFIGYNIGVGAEYAFTQNWIARVEYIYDGFGKRTYDFGSPAPDTFDTKKVDLSENTIRAAIEYKF